MQQPLPANTEEENSEVATMSVLNHLTKENIGYALMAIVAGKVFGIDAMIVTQFIGGYC